MRNPLSRVFTNWCLPMLALAFLCSCATAQSLTGPARPALTYECRLDEARCRLIASAAAESTAMGFPVVERKDGDITFLPGEAQGVFAGECDVEQVGHVPLTRLCGPPAFYNRGLTYWVNIVPGARFRRSDFVRVVEDDVFSVVRRSMEEK